METATWVNESESPRELMAYTWCPLWLSSHLDRRRSHEGLDIFESHNPDKRNELTQLADKVIYDKEDLKSKIVRPHKTKRWVSKILMTKTPSQGMQQVRWFHVVMYIDRTEIYKDANTVYIDRETTQAKYFDEIPEFGLTEERYLTTRSWHWWTPPVPSDQYILKCPPKATGSRSLDMAALLETSLSQNDDLHLMGMQELDSTLSIFESSNPGRESSTPATSTFEYSIETAEQQIHTIVVQSTVDYSGTKKIEGNRQKLNIARSVF